jgi:hypothetical protein
VNRRVLAFVLLAGGLLFGGLFLVTGRTPRPAPAGPVASAPPPVEAPPPAPRDTRPEPGAKAPTEAPRPAAPPRRPAAPARSAAAPVDATAAPTRDGAMVQIEVDVPDAQVFVDRVFIGKAPLTTTDVKVGSHRLNVSAAGYEGVAQPLEVKPGMQQVVIKLREVRLDASLDVVHKHRMGSCTGRLIATAKGLRYDTTEKNDSFNTGLVDLDEFEVDYLKKNLRIKPKQGKTYDFTDPEGNADRLFVFHRDVAKARERLKKGDTPASE